jgi:hypothetical protein
VNNELTPRRSAVGLGFYARSRDTFYAIVSDKITPIDLFGAVVVAFVEIESQHQPEVAGEQC